LTWLLLSFILPLMLVFYLVIYLIFPFYLVFYFGIYLANTPSLAGSFDKGWASAFNFKMAIPPLELFCLFMLLCIFGLMIPGKDRYAENQSFIKDTLFKKFRDEKSNVSWKILFFILINIQYMALFLLFIIGISDVNLYHTGLIFFFIVYMASSTCYRKTSILLVMFGSFFIWGQYFWTVYYEEL
jgi:hypothetical protein